MLSPLLKASSWPRAFLWSFPDCPVRIHVQFEFIERLRKEVLGSPNTNSETGGLLLGNVLSSTGDIEVSDYLPLPPDSKATKHFVPSPDSIENAIRSAPAQGCVVGFYRTHLDQRVHLREQDLECIRSKFNDPRNVFLIIRPHDARVSAGFFFWNEGSVVGGLTFPFSTTELKSRSWTTLMGGSSHDTLRALLVEARERARRLSTGIRIGLLILGATVIAVAGVFEIYHAKADSPHNLGLHIERSLLGVIIGWNAADSDVAHAKQANLLIFDGASPAAVLPLTASELHAGRMFFPADSGRVEARMVLISADGKPITESAISVSRAETVAPPETAGTTTNAAIAAPELPLPEPSLPDAGPPKKGQDERRASFQPAVPIHEVRPEIRSDLKPLIRSDNVVEIQVTISAAGAVTGAQMAHTEGAAADLLSNSALNAARRWRFRPALRDGEAVESKLILEFVFPSSALK